MWIIVLHWKMIWTGASTSEFHRWCMFSDDKSCCAGLAELTKRSLVFPKTFVVISKKPTHWQQENARLYKNCFE